MHYWINEIIFKLEINCETLSNFIFFFHKEINEINNTGAQKLDFIYHMTPKLHGSRDCAWKHEECAIYMYTLRLHWRHFKPLSKIVSEYDQEIPGSAVAQWQSVWLGTKMPMPCMMVLILPLFCHSLSSDYKRQYTGTGISFPHSHK